MWEPEMAITGSQVKSGGRATLVGLSFRPPSFDVDEEGLTEWFNLVWRATCRITIYLVSQLSNYLALKIKPRPEVVTQPKIKPRPELVQYFLPYDLYCLYSQQRSDS
jgi:hypothetical protein